MFPFDHSALPQLTSRKAIIVVDFQNDFLAPEGALLATQPSGLIPRVASLVTAFRSAGDVIWIKSHRQAKRPVDPDQIIVSDTAPPPKLNARGRRRPQLVELGAAPADPEAFLSQDTEDGAASAERESWRWQMPDDVQKLVNKGDSVLTKTQYSAFQDTQLLMILRAKMVMDVVICGSLMNVGVYATAMEAATHGLSITVVEDCSSYRSDVRQRRAIANLIELTGCEIASADEILETIQPPKPASSSPLRPPARTDPANPDPADSETRKSLSPGLVKPMTGLRLESEIPALEAADPHPAPSVAEESAAGGTDMTAAEAELQGCESAQSNHPEDSRQNLAVDKLADLSAKGNELPTVEKTKEDSEPETDSNVTDNVHSPPQAVIMTAEPVESVTDASFPDASTQKGLCEGDTDIIEDILPSDLVDGVFDRLREEIRWQRMSHQGGEVPRLVAVQGSVAEDGSLPVYRHPADESPPLLPFSQTVLAIKAETERHLGHSLNHVLIQFYRDGRDYISEHSDKTLDIVRESYIANVSLGAERTMVLRTKRQDKDLHAPKAPEPATPQVETATQQPSQQPDTKRKIQRARLPHNSLCRMGLQTNMKWLHAIRQDKRAEREKTSSELAFEGGRISLTFRQVGTFLDADETLIWGQGATGKTREEAGAVINGQSPEAVEMLRAFGTENQSSTFDWEEHYGKGFNVLHINAAPRLFGTGDAAVDLRVSLMLAELEIRYAKGRVVLSNAAESTTSEAEATIKFTDVDDTKSTVTGDAAILLYLHAAHGSKDKNSGNGSPTSAQRASLFTRFVQGRALLSAWRTSNTKDAQTAASKSLQTLLAPWEAYASEVTQDRPFIAGTAEPSIADFALWPALRDIVDHSGGGASVFDGFSALKKYYELFEQRESVKKVLDKAGSKS